MLLLFPEIKRDEEHAKKQTLQIEEEEEEETPVQPPRKLQKKEISNYNATLLSLRDHLGKFGKLGRYSFRHLNFWAEGIVAGQYSGPQDEPNWDKHLDEVGECPIGPGVAKRPQKGTASTSNDFFHNYLLLQAEESRRRDDNFRQMMMAMWAAPGPAKTKDPPDATTRNMDSVLSWEPTEVKAYLEKNGFEDISQQFLDNDIDGSAFLSLDRETLQYLGIENPLKRTKLLGKILNLKKTI